MEARPDLPAASPVLHHTLSQRPTIGIVFLKPIWESVCFKTIFCEYKGGERPRLRLPQVPRRRHHRHDAVLRRAIRELLRQGRFPQNKP